MGKTLSIDENVKKVRFSVWIKQKSFKIAEVTSEKRKIAS